MLQKDNRHRILSIFFDDPVPQGDGFQLRELSRKAGVAPPSVKSYLEEFKKEGLIRIEKHRIHGYPLYTANRDAPYFKFLKTLNTLMTLKESGILEYLEEKCLPDTIILFGSGSKGEDIKESDLDIFLLCEDKKLDLQGYEKRLNRKISIFFSKKFAVLSKELKNNLINGIILKGYLKVF